jgi:hypothetical protein
MGLIAICVQWYAPSGLTESDLQTWFRRTIISAIFSLFLMLTASNFLVVRVPYLAGEKSASFLKGFVRPQPDECRGMSTAQCIRNKLSFDDSEIESYWGEGQIAVSRYIFLICYTCLLSHFGLLIGLLVVREDARRNLKSTTIDTSS